MRNPLSKPILFGILSAVFLLGFYFEILTFISGWPFAKSQFYSFWPYILSLSFGFGIQIGLFTYLKNAIHNAGQSGKILVVSGGTSTVAMISCCAHYLANLLPVIATTGFISLISQYQIELFWLGLISNLIGIIYISRKILQFKSSNGRQN